jgi:hypothetical protein
MLFFNAPAFPCRLNNLPRVQTRPILHSFITPTYAHVSCCHFVASARCDILFISGSGLPDARSTIEQLSLFWPLLLAFYISMLQYMCFSMHARIGNLAILIEINNMPQGGPSIMHHS